MILKEAATKGLTAEQVEKRYGVSKWTFYGWRKNRARPVGRGAQVRVAAPSQAAIKREIHAVLPGILREEIARSLSTLFGKRTR